MTNQVEEPKKKKLSGLRPVFDPPVVVEKMAATIKFVEDQQEKDDFFAPPKNKMSDVPTPTGSFDGCSFSATSQASWRSAFSSVCRMADEWLRHPKQKQTAMKSERLHADYMDAVKNLHEKWVAMNQGGRWA